MAYEADWSERESLMDTFVHDGELKKLSPEAYEHFEKGLVALQKAMTEAGIKGQF